QPREQPLPQRLARHAVCDLRAACPCPGTGGRSALTRSATQLAYPDPWVPDIADRIRAVSVDDKYKSVYVYELQDTSTFRYRVYNMVEALALPGQPRDVSATYFTRSELPILESLIGRFDTLVLCRARYTSRLDHLVSRARSAGCRVLFDVDDLVFDPQYVTLILETLDQELGEPAWDHWFAYISRVGAMLRLCDGVLTTNQFLADRIFDYSQLPTWILPNFLNSEQLRVSE